MQLSPSEGSADGDPGRRVAATAVVRRALAHDRTPWVAGVGALALLPLLTTDDEVLRYADLFLILSIAVVGLSLQQGRAGILNLGPGTYVGVGAYAAATLTYHTHLPMPLPLLAAPLVAPACAVLIGGAALLLSRLHFAMVSLYAALLVPVIAEQGGSFTGGDNGLAGLEPLEIAGHRPDGAALYAVLAALLLVAVAVGARIAAGPWGRAFVAVRVDDAAASSLGISPAATRLLAAVTAAAFGTVAGALLAQAWPGDCPSGFVGATCVVTPEFFGLDLSILLFAAVVIGGAASRAGPVVAVALLVALRWAFDTHQAVGGDWQTVIYGGLLMLTVVALPQGLSAAGLLLRERPGPVRDRAPAVTAALPDRRRPGASLEVRGLRAAFDGLVVLDDVALTAAAGEVHALVGANGSGKTTLINCVSGLVEPERGEVRMGGRPLPRVRSWRAHRRARMGIARTFQTPRVQPDLSVLDNVLQALFVEARRTRRRRPLTRTSVADRVLGARAAAMLEAVGLAAHADHPASRLTHGERRLLEIARALVNDPLVVLLDEPSAGLDAGESDRLLAVLRAVRSSGPAIVLVEHDLTLVRAVADVVTVLERGRVAACGPPSSLDSGTESPT